MTRLVNPGPSGVVPTGKRIIHDVDRIDYAMYEIFKAKGKVVPSREAYGLLTRKINGNFSSLRMFVWLYQVLKLILILKRQNKIFHFNCFISMASSCKIVHIAKWPSDSFWSRFCNEVQSRDQTWSF